MSPLNRKLLRDLLATRGQSLAIGLVIACGVATFVMSLTTLRSLETSQASYYDERRFADVFANVTRAPLVVAEEAAKIPGVAQVQARVVSDVTLDVADLPEPVTGRIISIPDDGRPVLNDLHLRRGRWVEPERPGEVLVSEAFALAHELQIGDSVTAILNGKLQELEIVGIAMSPEYVMSIKSGLSLPDNRLFGIFWMSRRQLEAAFDMDGAFSDLVIKLAPGASEAEVIRRLDDLLEPWGSVGAYGRDEQLSNRFLSDEIRSLRGMGMIVPIIFLAVAAFLLNVVLTRMIQQQREQIAALKAFGYTNLEVGWHYLKLVLLIAAGGAVVGTIVGLQLAEGLTSMYATFYKFPTFEVAVSPGIVASGMLVAAAVAAVGTLSAVRRAVVLPPAEAMRPEPPADFRPTIAERLGLQRLLAQPARIVLRNLERRPFKAALSVLGIATAAAVLVLGSFLNDAIDFMIEFGFFIQQRQDIRIIFVEPQSASALYEIENLPGVIRAEPGRSVAVRLRNGHREKRGAIFGMPADAELFRVIDTDMQPVSLPPEGVVLSDKLAELLDVRVGETVRVEVLEDERPVRDVPVTAIVREFAGTNAYMHVGALHKLLREGDTMTNIALQVDANKADELYRTLKRMPAVGTVDVKVSAVRNFMETQAANQKAMQGVNMIFAIIIAAGVVYNTARIALAERGRELATLRVIGFTRGEISAILLGELAVLTLLAIPVGLLMGYGFAAWAVTAFDSESFRIPLVVRPQTFGTAAAVVLLAATVSGLAVRRRLDNLDLVAVLKAKE